MRDPIGGEFQDVFQKWRANKQNVELWNKLNKIKNRIREKYRCIIVIFEELDSWSVADRLDMPVKVGQLPWWLSNDKNNLNHCEPHIIPILIDTSLITLNDARKVKKEVWKVIEHELKKSRPTSTRPSCGFPADAPPDLSTLLRCKGQKFEQYIRWYDLKMRGLTFRLIARIEHSFKETKEKEAAYQRVLARNKEIPITGGRVKGESTVRRGFNLVYIAINREEPPQKETDIPVLYSYSCPDHGTDCPSSCKNLDQFMQQFNRVHRDKPLRERLITNIKYEK